MIFGVGIDLLDVRRVENVLARYQRKALQRLMRPSEQMFYATSPELLPLGFAKIWTYKEAMIKALGRRPSPFSWLDFEVAHTSSGQPFGRFYGAALHLMQNLTPQKSRPFNIFLTLSDELPYVVATCVIEIG